jgi:uncharacterized protein (TIGR02246 family)
MIHATLLAASLLAAPSGSAPAAAGPPAGAEPPAAAVAAADRALAAAVAAGDPETFAALLAEDALFLGTGELRGREAVVAGWAPFFEPGGAARLAWEPTESVVAASGDLAYTTGDYTLTVAAEDGAASVTPGHYLTVWRREGEGPWRVAADGTRVEDRDRAVAETLAGRPEAGPEAAIVLSWRPERAVRAASGELAYGVGSYRVEIDSPAGRAALGGTYLTVWRGGEGGWTALASSLTPAAAVPE